MEAKYNGTQRRLQYGGNSYDSEAEGRWAVFLDGVGIRFVPHPVTFDTGKIYGTDTIKYTPDFYLCDYNIYCEVKPSDVFVEDSFFQRKISAAMDENHTPIGHGLMMLGPLNGFKGNDSKRRCIYGTWYKWTAGSIMRGEWLIGRKSENDNSTAIIFYEPKNITGFPHYPILDSKPDIQLTYSDNDIHASPAVYDAINKAQFAKRNGLFLYESEEKLEILYRNDFPDIPDEDDEALPFK